MQRSARRVTVRARCSHAAASLPPGRMKELSGESSAFMASISCSSRSICDGHDAQRLLAALLAFERAEIGAEIEQVVLDAVQHVVDFGERSSLFTVRSIALRARPITAFASSLVP